LLLKPFYISLNHGASPLIMAVTSVEALLGRWSFCFGRCSIDIPGWKRWLRCLTMKLGIRSFGLWGIEKLQERGDSPRNTIFKARLIEVFEILHLREVLDCLNVMNYLLPHLILSRLLSQIIYHLTKCHW